MEFGAFFFEFSLSIAYYDASNNMIASARIELLDVDKKEHLSGYSFCTHK